MVEAGAKLLPEDVMAEAILFGHRALQPLIDLQEELQKAVGKPKSMPYLEPGTGSVLDFVKAVADGAEFVVVDVETTGTDPKMADLVEIAAVKVKGGKIIDRWSTLVNPGRSIVGHQMHGITDEDVKKAPTPAEAAKQVLAFVGDALIVGHNVGFDLGFIEAALGDGTRFEQGRYLDTLVIAREGYPGSRELQAADAVDVLRHRARPGPPGAARRRGDRRPPDLVRGTTCRAGSTTLRDGIADSVRATRSGGDAKGLLEAARREARVSKSLFGLLHKKTVRELVLDEGIRMDGRGLTRSARSRSRSASCRAPTARACSPAARPRP